MERAVEWFAVVTCAVMGLSHLLQPQAWGETYAAMHRLGRPGAFLNGGLSLLPGAVFVAGHWVWSGPAMVLTIFGCLLVLKGTLCFLAPNLALRSMSQASENPTTKFATAGVFSLCIAAAIGYVLATT